MKKTWFRILCAAMLCVFLCMTLIACKDPNGGKNPEETTSEVSSSEITTEKPEPQKPDVPLDEKVGNKGENTDSEWGNDVIA